MKNTFSLLLLLCLFSCQKEGDLKQTLTGHQWGFVNGPTVPKSMDFVSGLIFETDGKCYNQTLNSKEKTGLGDWSYTEKDSTLTLYGQVFKIDSVKTDRILMHGKQNSNRALLLQINP
ncbi:hypothetical protein [Flavobacterium sp.]|uniref:hypothetical protein n=1 Tax=Flavobacterium sp. TaxID=239 RepID=UPI0039E575F0